MNNNTLFDFNGTGKPMLSMVNNIENIKERRLHNIENKVCIPPLRRYWAEVQLVHKDLPYICTYNWYNKNSSRLVLNIFKNKSATRPKIDFLVNEWKEAHYALNYG